MSNKLKILVVDDFEMIRSLIKQALIDVGFNNLSEATDGLEAYEKIVEAKDLGLPYELIFVDWNMPRMNGLELVQKCKANAELKHLPFIMISAEREQKTVVTALKSGVSDYILKPFSSAQIARKIQRIFNTSKVA